MNQRDRETDLTVSTARTPAEPPSLPPPQRTAQVPESTATVPRYSLPIRVNLSHFLVGPVVNMTIFPFKFPGKIARRQRFEHGHSRQFPFVTFASSCQIASIGLRRVANSQRTLHCVLARKTVDAASRLLLRGQCIGVAAWFPVGPLPQPCYDCCPTIKSA